MNTSILCGPELATIFIARFWHPKPCRFSIRWDDFCGYCLRNWVNIFQNIVEYLDFVSIGDFVASLRGSCVHSSCVVAGIPGRNGR